ncbi:hypothetical protein SPHINGO361_120648 [Sphingomonas sp. EC-HK361]|nr:hypothetical protein SPHINGO361_120648 [Sphingomonas sp. EC-HK361]
MSGAVGLTTRYIPSTPIQRPARFAGVALGDGDGTGTGEGSGEGATSATLRSTAPADPATSVTLVSGAGRLHAAIRARHDMADNGIPRDIGATPFLDTGYPQPPAAAPVPLQSGVPQNLFGLWHFATLGGKGPAIPDHPSRSAAAHAHRHRIRPCRRRPQGRARPLAGGCGSRGRGSGNARHRQRRLSRLWRSGRGRASRRPG